MARGGTSLPDWFDFLLVKNIYGGIDTVEDSLAYQSEYVLARRRLARRRQQRHETRTAAARGRTGCMTVVMGVVCLGEGRWGRQKRPIELRYDYQWFRAVCWFWLCLLIPTYGRSFYKINTNLIRGTLNRDLDFVPALFESPLRNLLTYEK